MHRIQIDKSYLFKIQHDPVRVPINLCLQLLHVFRFNPPGEPENGFWSIRHSLDFQDYLRISITNAKSATVMP
jgi:hypothetical protein